MTTQTSGAREDRSTMQAVIGRYYDQLFNRGQVEIIDQLLADDYVNHSPGAPDQPRDRAGVVAVVRALRAAFPDLHYQVEDLVVGDDAVAVRTSMTGTHLGNFFGLPATGRRFRVAQMCIERFRGGKIVAHHRLTDLAGLMQQLGA